MVLVVILIAAGVTTLSLVAPFGSLLDLANDDVAVWRLPHSGHKTIYLTFDEIRERPRFRDTISRTVPFPDRQLRPS
jgi:hypothetical protein